MGKINENIAVFRKRAGMTQEELGLRINKHRSTIQGYETGASDIPYSIMEKLCKELNVSMVELITGEKQVMKQTSKVKIYNLDDRLSVAQILIKNGYTVAQGKEKRTPDGRSMVYYLAFREDEGNVETN